MSLDVDDPEIERMVREIVEVTGETEAEALKVALHERLVRVKPAQAATRRAPVDEAERRRRLDALLEHGRRFRALPVLDPRSPEEILDYDEHGLSR